MEVFPSDTKPPHLLTEDIITEENTSRDTKPPNIKNEPSGTTDDEKSNGPECSKNGASFHSTKLPNPHSIAKSPQTDQEKSCLPPGKYGGSGLN